MSYKKILISLLLLVTTQAHGAMLYDAGLGTTPSLQGWFFLPNKPGGSYGMNGGAYRMDTSADASIQAANSISYSNLDSINGYTLNINLKINAESHANNNRAGFSFITLSQDVTKSLEIAFWDDRIWVYDYVGNNFIKGAEYLVDTTQRRDYRLQVQNQQFALYVDNILGISGNLVDYSPFGFPYNVSSALIFGDDTTSGSSSVDIYSIQAVPLPASLLLFISGLGLLRFTSSIKRNLTLKTG